MDSKQEEREIEKVVLYHIPQTRSVRPLLLAHEMGLLESPKFEVKIISWKELKAPEFAKINPNQASPSMKIIFKGGEEQGMWEAGAIFDFLLRAFPDEAQKSGMVPATWNLWNWQRHTQYSFWSITTIDTEVFGRMFGVKKVSDLLTNSTEKWFTRVVAPTLEQHLKENADGYLNGPTMTATDVLLAYSLSNAKSVNLIKSDAILKYFERVSQREAFQKVCGPTVPEAKPKSSATSNKKSEGKKSDENMKEKKGENKKSNENMKEKKDKEKKSENKKSDENMKEKKSENKKSGENMKDKEKKSEGKKSESQEKKKDDMKEKKDDTKEKKDDMKEKEDDMKEKEDDMKEKEDDMKEKKDDVKEKKDDMKEPKKEKKGKKEKMKSHKEEKETEDDEDKKKNSSDE